MKEKTLIVQITKYSLSEKTMEIKWKKLDDMINEFETIKKQIPEIVEKIGKNEPREIQIAELEEVRNQEEEEIEKYLRTKLPKNLLESFEDNKEFFVLKFRRECKKQIERIKKSK